MNSFILLDKGKAIPVMARSKDFNEKDVLGKAIDLFWLKGYNGTSMQDLVDGLGISRSSLYDTFGDKHSLFIKALESYQNDEAAKICNLVSSNSSAVATIKRLLEHIVRGLLNDAKQKGCFMVNAEVEVAPHDDLVSQMICKNDQQVQELVYNLIKKSQEKGEMNQSKDATALSRFIMNTVKGIRVTAKSTTDRIVFDDIINTAIMVLQ